MSMDSGLSIAVDNGDLLLAARIDRNRAKRLATPGNVFDDILRSTSGATLRWISDEDARAIDEAVRRHWAGNPPPPSSAGPLMAPPPSPDAEELSAVWRWGGRVVAAEETAVALPQLSPMLPSVIDTMLVQETATSAGVRGQGFQMSAEERRAVEQRTMCVAAQQLQKEGWTVADKSGTESYDLLCSRGKCRVYAEVKGTTTAGDQIIITYPEVEFAKTHQQDMLLVVVSEIEVIPDESGRVSARGGRSTIRRGWAPEPSQLRPVSYICRLSATGLEGSEKSIEPE